MVANRLHVTQVENDQTNFSQNYSFNNRPFEQDFLLMDDTLLGHSAFTTGTVSPRTL